MTNTRRRPEEDVRYHVVSEGVRELVGYLLDGCRAGDAMTCPPEPRERVMSEEINP